MISAGSLESRMIEMPMKIGELARQAGVGVETIRYYQRRGLLRIPPRPPGSYRRYSRDMVDTIVQIRKLRTLGFSLEEIRMLLQGQAEACRDVRVSIERHIGSTGRKLKELTWRLGCLQRALKEIPCEKDRRCCGLVCLTVWAKGPQRPFCRKG
ncbi:Cu(I)-responsive transcriptional regulator [Castellaniella daejeonensis]|jgi:MerR family mercuric resistance operon transcriptional regulator|uniref:Cu(I)-responsive transcriptional regulator n=2 Tax=Castellaniella daejeonensis TaxID=659013 RepID=A0ABN0TQJ2_9BURK